MKPGDKVILNETMDDLKAGMTGVVVSHRDYFDEEIMSYDGHRLGIVAVVKKVKNVLAVSFDGRESISVGRYVNNKYTLVVSKCSVLLILVVLLFTQCSVPNSIERYTYVRPTWTHAKGMKQCPSYHSNKPVKRSSYWRLQQFNREFSKSN